ncbi:Phosphoenolpyruvate synthase OS=Vibrio sp. B183 GN=IX95_08425 PE=4 SV=1: DUF2007 [Gemmataceae bacterium]|nr:Phosphoenolpyruvate synthase OS=Vibrio sp. B183 GN=IX95_08425 PE=4 SV=1: DUF2007 [Gemmataceae bacterium]VTU01766.1 Phosphoenolpyruvate synthase OS=Vibrio sp. B183 GN=IX95_08425 PE=4 SV=1: DUF2007 [Gemmataceae bacterium]
MGKKLVTIATFDQAAQARLAKNALDAAGVQATVTDESLVAMDWLLSNAIGGIKVQVWDEDAERAVAVLNETLGDPETGTEVSPEELAAQAEAAEPDDAEGPPEPEPAAAPEDQYAPVSERDEYARRLVFTSWLGLMFPPFAFYAFYLFLNAAFGEGVLSPRGRYNLLVGGLIVIPTFALGLILLKLFFTA